MSKLKSCHFCYKYKVVNDEGFCEACESSRNKCDICGNLFIKNVSHQKRCSEECRRIALKRSYTPVENSGVGIERKCDVCKKMFVTRTGNQRRCSTICTQMHLKNSKDKSRLEIFIRDEFQCIYCGGSSIEDLSELHVDHIYPIDLKGRDIAANLVTSCQRCNLEKHSRLLPTEIRRRIYRQVRERNKTHEIHPCHVVKLTTSRYRKWGAL